MLMQGFDLGRLDVSANTNKDKSLGHLNMCLGAGEPCWQQHACAGRGCGFIHRLDGGLAEAAM